MPNLKGGRRIVSSPVAGYARVKEYRRRTRGTLATFSETSNCWQTLALEAEVWTLVTEGGTFGGLSPGVSLRRGFLGVFAASSSTSVSLSLPPFLRFPAVGKSPHMLSKKSSSPIYQVCGPLRAHGQEPAF